jgi:3-deoxy-D-manno-octulosonic-acid transferase
MTEGPARTLYTLAWYLALPFAALYLLWRGLRQREYLRHWGERFLGHGARHPADGAETVWVHAVSVGETRAAQPLVEALARARPGARFVLTHMTPTGRATGRALARSHAGRLVQRYLPYDLPTALANFFAEAQPTLGIVLETEAWPNLLFAARARGIPMMLVNARLSERSLARGLRFASLMRPAARAFTCIAAQTESDRARLARLYAGPIAVLGNLKFDLAPDAAQLADGRAWRAACGTAPVWLFATTREGEEAMLLEALQGAVDLRAADSPALIVVPRHPQRFDEVAKLVMARGLPMQRRSEAGSQAVPVRGGVLLGDTMGEMALYYAAADVAIVGGSFQPLGGHNLIEAAACGCPVVVGPHMFNFAQATADAVAAGAALQVVDAAAAIAAVLALTADAARREQMVAAAAAFSAAHRGATARTVQMVDDVIGTAPRAAPAVREDAPVSAPAAR